MHDHAAVNAGDGHASHGKAPQTCEPAIRGSTDFALFRKIGARDIVTLGRLTAMESPSYET
jgi:hypothetical protein